jgi:hypothetical protein
MDAAIDEKWSYALEVRSDANHESRAITDHAKGVRFWLLVTGVLLGSGVAVSSSALNGSLTRAQRNASAACSAYLQRGLAAAMARSSAPIVVRLTASYATTALGVLRWGGTDWGRSVPTALRNPDPSTPISVCYLTDTAMPQGWPTEVLALVPHGIPVLIRYGPAKSILISSESRQRPPDACGASEPPMPATAGVSVGASATGTV